MHTRKLLRLGTMMMGLEEDLGIPPEGWILDSVINRRNLSLITVSFRTELGLTLDFADALLRGDDAAEETHQVTAKLIRKRKLLVSDPETEISKKDYSQHQKDTSNIIKKVSAQISS